MEHYNKRNESERIDYEKLLQKVQEIFSVSSGKANEKWTVFFHKTSLIILTAAEIEKDMSASYLKNHTLDELIEFNKSLNKEKLPEYYQESFLNPEYSVKCFGQKRGRLNSVIYNIIYHINILAFEHKIFKMEHTIRLFCNYYDAWLESSGDYEKLHQVFKVHCYVHLYDNTSLGYFQRFSPKFNYYSDWIKSADLSDVRYLFYYGTYISNDDIKTAEFLNSLPQEKIDRVMSQTAKAYIMGFEEANKDYKKKKTVSLYLRAGMERLARSLILELENKYGLMVTIPNVATGKFDQQVIYDHRFDNALYLDEEYVNHFLNEVKRAIDDNSLIINECSGGIYFDPFGETPFAPESKKECLKYDDTQMKLSQKLRSEQSIMFNKYYKRSENSFCIIGFPTPEIGERFEEIFDKTIDINMLDHEHWLKIQQYLIDALDQADRVLITGTNGNKTSLTVKLPKLSNPEKQTNFANCGATVNIPVGEVFNTPQLKGTNGNLHISETFLNSLYYKDLNIEFTDGRITSYDCKNYPADEDNKKYIEENLIFPHKSLPLGEFAIGTNTLAYAVAKKYDILSVLPILIIEKMGPHFAIGDTCYSWEEDTPVFNPDGKEIISRDNEHTLIRKEDPSKAYTNVHVDITLPYEEIGLIQAVKENGDTIDIIKNGRFVLSGTEELNDFFDKI